MFKEFKWWGINIVSLLKKKDEASSNYVAFLQSNCLLSSEQEV